MSSWSPSPHHRADFAREGLLVIRVGPRAYAVALDDVGGLATDRVVTALPAAPPELMGIASFRGAAVPVYDLRVILGHPSVAPPRCSLVTRDRKVALGFDALQGRPHLRGSAVRAPAGAAADQDQG